MHSFAETAKNLRGSSVVNRNAVSSPEKRSIQERKSVSTSKKVNPDQQSIKEIISKVRRMRGSNPISSNLQSMSEKVQKQMLAQNLRDHFIADTANQVHSFRK